jgi:hypothetical protein
MEVAWQVRQSAGATVRIMVTTVKMEVTANWSNGHKISENNRCSANNIVYIAQKCIFKKFVCIISTLT